MGVEQEDWGEIKQSTLLVLKPELSENKINAVKVMVFVRFEAENVGGIVLEEAQQNQRFGETFRTPLDEHPSFWRASFLTSIVLLQPGLSSPSPPFLPDFHHPLDHWPFTGNQVLVYFLPLPSLILPLSIICSLSPLLPLPSPASPSFLTSR